MKYSIVIILVCISSICKAQFYLELNEAQARIELQKDDLINITKKYNEDGTFRLMARFPSGIKAAEYVLFDDHNFSYKSCVIPDDFEWYQTILQSYNNTWIKYSNNEWHVLNHVTKRIVKILDSYTENTHAHIFFFTYIN